MFLLICFAILSYLDWGEGDTALSLNQIQQPLLIIFDAEWNLGARDGEKMGEEIDTMEFKVKIRPNHVFLSYLSFFLGGEAIQ